MNPDPFQNFLSHSRNDIKSFQNSYQFQNQWPQTLNDYMDTQPTFDRIVLSVERFFGTKCDPFSTLGIREYVISCLLPADTIEELLEIADEIVRPIEDPRVSVSTKHPDISNQEMDASQKLRDEFGSVPGPEYILVIKGFYSPLALSRRS